MTSPVLVHRYKVRLSSLAAAISKRQGIAEDQIEARVADGALILDIIGDQAGYDSPADQPAPESPAAPQPEEMKGGARAKRAAIIAGEGAFLKWGEFASPDAATAWIKEQCRVASRRELDYNSEAAEIFDRIDSRYRAWLDGY